MPIRLRLESGSCFCGNIALEARGEPFWISYDHDDDCRKALGGPLTVWIGYRCDQINFTRGTPKAISRTQGVRRTFCADCGSSIGYAEEGLPGECWLTIGFMDHPERFQPTIHAFWSMKLPWASFADGLPRVGRHSRNRLGQTGFPDQRK